jgi:hypothetical protein
VIPQCPNAVLSDDGCPGTLDPSQYVEDILAESLTLIRQLDNALPAITGEWNESDQSTLFHGLNRLRRSLLGNIKMIGEIVDGSRTHVQSADDQDPRRTCVWPSTIGKILVEASNHQPHSGSQESEKWSGLDRHAVQEGCSPDRLVNIVDE